MTSCRQASVKSLVVTDFDDLSTWLSTRPKWLTTARAHSGKYASVIAHDAYGAVFQTTWGKLDSPHRLRLRTWAWLPHGRVKVMVVVQVVRGQENLFWQTLRVNDNVRRYGQWEPVERDFTLPNDLHPTDQVKIVFWQLGPMWEDIYFDDFSLDKL